LKTTRTRIETIVSSSILLIEFDFGVGKIRVIVRLLPLSVKLERLRCGPRVTLRTGNLEPFAHALFGAANGRAEASGIGLAEGESGTAFTYALGGGLDLKVHDNFAIRLGQLDYLRTRVSGEGLNSARYSVGIVIRTGSR
jgi:hypothetical protein